MDSGDLGNLLSGLFSSHLVCHARRMHTPSINRYKPHRFPGEIFSHAVWLSCRFCLSYRDVEELLFARGVTVTYEAIRQWCRKFGQSYANELRHRRPKPALSTYCLISTWAGNKLTKPSRRVMVDARRDDPPDRLYEPSTICRAMRLCRSITRPISTVVTCPSLTMAFPCTKV
jgi:hypothetical protein